MVDFLIAGHICHFVALSLLYVIHDQIFVLVFESFVILPYVRPTSRPKCLVMHLNGLEWFCGYISMDIMLWW